jgi:hypothetical protein
VFSFVGLNVAPISELLLEKLRGFVKMAVRQTRAVKNKSACVLKNIAEDEFVSRHFLNEDSKAAAAAFRALDAGHGNFAARLLNRHQ